MLMIQEKVFLVPRVFFIVKAGKKSNVPLLSQKYCVPRPALLPGSAWIRAVSEWLNVITIVTSCDSSILVVPWTSSYNSVHAGSFFSTTSATLSWWISHFCSEMLLTNSVQEKFISWICSFSTRIAASAFWDMPGPVKLPEVTTNSSSSGVL